MNEHQANIAFNKMGEIDYTLQKIGWRLDSNIPGLSKISWSSHITCVAYETILLGFQKLVSGRLRLE
jgi:hypothetical protein